MFRHEVTTCFHRGVFFKLKKYFFLHLQGMQSTRVKVGLFQLGHNPYKSVFQISINTYLESIYVNMRGEEGFLGELK